MKKKEEEKKRDEEELTFEKEEEASNPQEIIKKLRKRLKDCNSERTEFLTGWQKTKADFINLRKQDEVEKKELIKLANKDLIEQILPVLDSFEQSFKDSQFSKNTDKNWLKGVESIAQQLKSVLERNGLRSLSPEGEDFDPRFHEAISSSPVSEMAMDQKVLEVRQTGYTLGDRVIRTAKVVVGEYDHGN
jgi:molecular chaperone GrpE